PDFEAAFGPVTQVEAVELLGLGCRCAFALRRPDEHFDGVAAGLVDEHGGGTRVDRIDAAAFEHVTVRVEVFDGRGEVARAGEPGFEGVVVGGDDVDQMRVELHRADVVVYELGGEIG